MNKALEGGSQGDVDQMEGDMKEKFEEGVAKQNQENNPEKTGEANPGKRE